MIKTNCNCGTKIDCGCLNIRFETVSLTTTSVLEVGNLISDNCVFDEYVIDWYRDGQHALVSGFGYDSDIQAFHPMVGASAVPVIGGTYTPIIRYVVINGQQIFFEPKSCHTWCGVNNVLPEITVSRLNCLSTNLTTTYQYRISYSSNDPASLPSRTIAWDLPDPNGVDGRLKYFGVGFTGYDVVDEIEVLFNGVTSLANWQVGNSTANGFTSRYLTKPYRRLTSSQHQFVITIPDDYVLGDFLIIKVTPSVIQPEITQTNWQVDLKCIPNSVEFDCDIFNNIEQLREFDLTDWSFVFDEANCRRLFSLKMKNPWHLPYNWHGTSNPFRNYTGSGASNYSTTQDYVTSQYIRVGLQHQVNYNWQSYSLPSYSIRYPSQDEVTIEKIGTTIKFTFNSVDDYNDAYNNYQQSLTTLWWTNRSLDPSDVRYYRWWNWNWRSRPLNCGDTLIGAVSLYFHHTSLIEFNSDENGHTLTIIPSLMPYPNQWNNEPCNYVVSNINSTINQSNNFVNRADFTQSTFCFEQKFFGYGIGHLEPTSSWISRDSNGGYALTFNGNTHDCFPFNGTCITETSSVMFIAYIRVMITITVDSEGNWQDGRDPLQNFVVYNLIMENNCDVMNTTNKILEIQDGIQIYPPIE